MHCTGIGQTDLGRKQDALHDNFSLQMAHIGMEITKTDWLRLGEADFFFYTGVTPLFSAKILLIQ